LAQYYLGEIYGNGEGVPVDRKKAFKWYKLSAHQNYVPAMQRLSQCYFEGLGTKKNEEMFYLWLTELVFQGDEESLTLMQTAANSGNRFAQYGMAVYFKLKKNDEETSLHWLEKSADQGFVEALCARAVLYEEEGNDEQKLKYFRLAAEKGHVDSQCRLGLLCEVFSDRKAPENEEAFKLVKSAADQGHPYANYCLGNFYRDGTWVDADAQKAFEHYSKASSTGNSDGIDRTGECYSHGVGVEIDQHLAFQYYKRAAEMKNPKGILHLGLSYLQGQGCNQDTELGFKWISYAATTGNPIVFQMLKDRGLDVEKLVSGYRESRKNWTAAAIRDDRLDSPFGQIFDKGDMSLSLRAIPPSGNDG
jgi:TPR repeat protein